LGDARAFGFGHDRGMLTDFSNELAGAVTAAAPSVVQVQGRRRPASGLVHSREVVVTTMRAIGREDGLHVRDNEGRAFEAELVGWDPATSLAVLRVAGLDAPMLTPSAAAVRVGHLALAVARSWSNQVTASAGIVAVIGGPLPTGRRRSIDQVFRTTAPMHDGFSGGAFLDAGGGLIGLTTAASIRGFGVVIPASIVWKAAAAIIEHGAVKRGYLGIAGQPVALPDHQRGSTGRDRGLLVLAVTEDAPAARAGVLVGDVLLSYDGTAVESPEELMDLLAATGAGHNARLAGLRGGEPFEVTAAVAERPSR
jgi:S1-C subfamily serine protease